jgi:hypothetical protein
MDVAVSGTDELAAAAQRVADVLTSSETATAAAVILADAARPQVPRKTGKLAASEMVTPTTAGAVLEYAVPYAVPVYALRPWLPDAIAQAEAPILDLYTDHALTAWS